MATMLLQEKLEQRHIHIGDYIGFEPDFAKCTLTLQETGLDCEQNLHTEDGMYWQLIRINNQLALLADGNTIWRIRLKGKIGAEKGVKALRKYSQTCWSSKKFHARGTILTKNQFKQLPLQIKHGETVDRYWLGSSGKGLEKNRTEFDYNHEGICLGVYYVYAGKINFCGLSNSIDDINSLECAMRPVVLLPPDIMINDNDKLVPFDEADVDETQTEKSEARARLEAMIEDEEKKLKNLTEKFDWYIAQRESQLSKMKELLSKL